MNGFKGLQNTEGRTPGTPNKVTAKVRESFATLLENNLTTLQNDLNDLKPIERIKVLIDLANFIIPKMRSIEVSDNVERERSQVIIDMSKWK